MPQVTQRSLTGKGATKIKLLMQDVNTRPSAGAIIFRVPCCIFGNYAPFSYAALAGSTFLTNSKLQ